MRTRSIGSLQVSVVGLGCNNFGGRCDEAQTEAVVRASLDHGVTLFDTADIYGGTRSEEFLGRALASRRDEAVIATKFGHRVGEDEQTGGASARWIERAAEDSLRRLGTDRIDLYQLHRPDDDTPIEETLEALDRLVRAGKVREIGCSNFDAKQIREAEDASRTNGWARFVCVQNHHNLLHREPEAEVLPLCERLGIAFLPYFPLASGFLTGKYRPGQAPPEGTRLASAAPERAARYLNDETFAALERLESFAAERGRRVLEVAIAWLAAFRPVASVIAGATKPEQVRANVEAATWQMTPAEAAEVAALVA